MTEVSDSVDSITRKSLTTILNAVELVGQNTIADACGVDNSTITGDKAKYWPRFAKTLAVAGLKVVPAGSRCYTPESIEPLLALAKQRMAQLTSVNELEWGET
jgi:hypothetical protein